MIIFHICLFISNTHPIKKRNLNVGGIANQILQLLPSYEKIKDLHISIVTQYSEYKPISNRVKIYEVHKFENFILDTIYYIIKSFFQILKIQKKTPINVLNTHELSIVIISPILIRMLFKIPLLMKLPIDITSAIRDSSYRTVKLKVYRYSWLKFLRRFILKRIDFIRPINELMVKQLRERNYPIERMLRIPNGINSKNFIGIEKDKREEIHFGYVGRLIKFKNLRFMVKVFQEYLSKYPNDILYIYGRGSEKNYIQDFISGNKLENNIILRGYEKRKEKIYKNIDVLIDPALAQGLSNANLEAMYTGTFLIASNVQGNKDIVKHRITGLLFNPFNEKDLLKQLFIFKNDKKLVQEVIINAKKEVITNYDIDVVANKIYTFLKSRL